MTSYICGREARDMSKDERFREQKRLTLNVPVLPKREHLSVGSKALCLIFQNCISKFWEYNIKRVELWKKKAWNCASTQRAGRIFYKAVHPRISNLWKWCCLHLIHHRVFWSRTLLILLVSADAARTHKWKQSGSESVRIAAPSHFHCIRFTPGKSDTVHPDILCCSFKPHMIPLNHSVHFICVCLHPPFIHPSLSLKAKCALILCFSLFFTFKAHCSQLRPELKRLSEAPLAESALRDLPSSEEKELPSSVTQSGHRK